LKKPQGRFKIRVDRGDKGDDEYGRNCQKQSGVNPFGAKRKILKNKA